MCGRKRLLLQMYVFVIEVMILSGVFYLERRPKCDYSEMSLSLLSSHLKLKTQKHLVYGDESQGKAAFLRSWRQREFIFTLEMMETVSHSAPVTVTS